MEMRRLARMKPAKFDYVRSPHFMIISSYQL